MFFVLGVEFYYLWLVNLDVAVYSVCLKSLFFTHCGYFINTFLFCMYMYIYISTHVQAPCSFYVHEILFPFFFFLPRSLLEGKSLKEEKKRIDGGIYMDWLIDWWVGGWREGGGFIWMDGWVSVGWNPVDGCRVGGYGWIDGLNAWTDRVIRDKWMEGMGR